MVIERFKNRDAEAVYRRYHEKGRMMHEGLQYVASWTERNLNRCFQVMECDDTALFQRWIDNWKDLVDFGIVPVLPRSEASVAALGEGKR